MYSVCMYIGVYAYIYVIILHNMCIHDDLDVFRKTKYIKDIHVSCNLCDFGTFAERV